jgi:hypothetical protein
MILNVNLLTSFQLWAMKAHQFIKNFNIYIIYTKKYSLESNTLANSDSWKEEVCDWCVNALDSCQQRTLIPIMKGLKNH